MLGIAALLYVQFFPTLQLVAFSAQPMGWILLFAIAIAFAMSCYQAVRREDFIELSPDGLVFRRGTLHRIAWKEIASIERGRNFLVPAIILHFHRPRPINPAWSLLSLWRDDNRHRTGTELRLLPASFGVEVGDLYKALEPRVTALSIF